MNRESEDLLFRDSRLPENPAPADLRAAAADYEAICLANIQAVVERFERHGGTYPFVDTKLDLRTGRDHPAGDLVRGRDTIYGWIQGRGLEAVAGHALWAEADPRPPLQALAPRLRAMAAAVLGSVRRLRDRNEGHLFFFMSPDGSPFALGPGNRREPVEITAATPSGFSDLFGARGLFAGARLLGDSAAEAEAVEWMERGLGRHLVEAFRQRPAAPRPDEPRSRPCPAATATGRT